MFKLASVALLFSVQGALRAHPQASDITDSIHAAINNGLGDYYQSAITQEDAEPQRVAPPPLEVQPLVVSGPSDNRVDLVFFGDGYLQEERDKFFEDSRRLAEEVSSNQTFNTVQPLLNFWAAFTPSEESGVGVGGQPRNTVYGLYRQGTELRGLYYARPEVADAACISLGTQCDYPILLGNDELYGGLGGRFTTVTASNLNGPLILRHELGHSIIDVGEEYDGGSAYFGVNSFRDLSQPVPWAHWLTDSTATQEQRSVMPIQNYAWTLLNTTTPWSTTFSSAGTYSRYLIRISLSGLPSQTDLRVEFDGEDLNWVPRDAIGVDRWFYDYYGEEGLAGGQHEVKFILLNSELEGQAQMCSIQVLEFGTEEEFISTPGYYGVFPTFSWQNATSYRPTNEDCLMRQQTTANFCSVCKEGLWLSLFRNVTLIESLDESCLEGTATKVLNATIISIGQLRNKPIEGLQERLKINWTKDGQVLDAWKDQTVVQVDGDEATGEWVVEVTYVTDEIRVDSEGLARDKIPFNVTEACVP